MAAREISMPSCPTPMRVFSHRGNIGDPQLDAPPFFLRKNPFAAGRSHDIHAYDLDLSFTADLKIVVGHPDDVQKALGVSVWQSNLAQLAAQKPRRHLLDLDRLLDLAVVDANITLALDLKGSTSANYASMLTKVANGVRLRALETRVWLWIERSVRPLSSDLKGLQLLRPLRDRGVADAPPGFELQGDHPDCSFQLKPTDAAAGFLIGPSYKCANRHLLAQKWALDAWGVAPAKDGAPARRSKMLVWVVEPVRAQLDAMLELGVGDLISNDPLALLRMVRRACGS